MSLPEELKIIYPTCCSSVSNETWDKLVSLCGSGLDPQSFPNIIKTQKDNNRLPDYLSDLAKLEWAINFTDTNTTEIPLETEVLTVNPTVQLLDLSWKNLPQYIQYSEEGNSIKPEQGDELVLVWRNVKSGEVKYRVATEGDLLALKIVVEGIDPKQAAEEGDTSVGAVEAILRLARGAGILLPLRSKMRREATSFPVDRFDEKFLVADVFTLQWHITQTCDLHCKHCYDRSKRSPLSLEQGFSILDDLYDFCRAKNVSGQVSFTGGNPLLYPNFWELYQAATDRDFAVAILGNPTSSEQIEKMRSIEHPVFYQVSLEGLKEHNDMIRGKDHFDNVMDFLKVLKASDVYSMVMLTLTKDNMDQVLPLAEILRDKADLFTFNRLSMVGEGASLLSAPTEGYADFLRAYTEAAQTNPVMGLKDNLFNLLRHEQGVDFFGGCAGYGCGAAFNFVSVLPDGEVHACRKFSSLIGNIFEQSLIDLYESEMAQRYRAGCSLCKKCDIRAVCGGCLAVSYGQGLDVFEERDPYCFLENQES